MTKEKIKVNMLSSSETIPGQGVSGAYRELMRLLKRDAKDIIDLTENQRIKADITHYHTIDISFYLSTFCKKRVGRRIGYVHFLPNTLRGSLRIPKIVQPIVAKYVTSFYNRMDHLVVVNPSFIEDLVAFGIDRDKITYIPNFVNSEKWFRPNADDRIAVRKRYDWTEEDFVVLGAGQIQKRKGIDDFVTLAKTNSDIQFVWAGGFSFGGMTDGYDVYKKLMKNPPTNLTFTGIVEADEMRQLYGACDLFLLPSFSELFPMTILEAAACGAPIMLRDLDLYRIILEGMYLPASDVSKMGEAIRHLRAYPTALNHLKTQSENISKTYSEERLLKTWIDFYRHQADLK
ncbi:glycosyltransferase family 4 protein [Streptococcus sciuri]|uniref:Glycosyltransferase family 4 protein n=1 Tax=Streptococcus sciuri TaxID=2973939 RepID=A0ABT2F7E9_9STRE|nr:glycosyltransferase family 4 protein [Streptococcus sciuri]MCS4488359.1 glycosyltransferase family 4 protein [Streptococcus sciuri]